MKKASTQHLLVIFIVLVFPIMSFNVFAEERVTVAVVSDGPQFRLKEVEQLFNQELINLTSGEFEIEFKPLIAEWSSSSVDEAMLNAYQDPAIDMVLVLGFAANQLVVSREFFPKPTFLPLVFNPELLSAPKTENFSGRKNLNYLADQVPFSEDIKSFQRVIPFSNALLITDIVILKALPQGPDVVQSQAAGVDFSFLGHDGVNHNLLEMIPLGTQSVILGGLPRMPSSQFKQLLADLAKRKIPVFSLLGESDVQSGALASDTVITDYNRLARRNALNMQAVMLGEETSKQPVNFDGKRQLTINMETARIIGMSPRFDVLSEAETINEEIVAGGLELDLRTIARLAVEQNLDLQVANLDVSIGQQDVASSFANLLPQLSIASSFTGRRDQELTRGPGSAQRSTNAALTLSQPVYIDSATSGYQQQRFLQQGRTAGFEAAQLDSVLEATTAFLQALRAANQLAIQQDNLDLTKTNLELARDRVRVGSASNADIYRWEANLASSRSSVLAAIAARNQTLDSLNRIMNQPFDNRFTLIVPAKDSPFTMPAEEFDKLIDNPRRFSWFVDYSVTNGLARAPELAQLESQINAIQRDVLAKRRAHYVPDVSVQAQYLDSLGASGVGSGTEFDDANDWNVSLNASWPIFTSGARKSQLERAKLQEHQLRLRKSATAERIEQSIRSSLHAAQASYININLSEGGAAASRKNLELVSDAYSQGTVSIIELLDAQNQSLQADLAANNAVHDFLIDIMSLQRSTNSFDFILSPAMQEERNTALREYIQERAAELEKSGISP